MISKTHKRIYITANKVFRNMLFQKGCFYAPRAFIADALIKEKVAIDLTNEGNRSIEDILKNPKKKKAIGKNTPLIVLKNTEN